MKALPILSEQSTENTVYPRTPLEELIASVWSQVLGIRDIDVQDSFFDLGGHSLLATQVVSRLQEVFQIKLPVRELFEYSTVEALSKRIDQLRKGSEKTRNSTIDADGTRGKYSTVLCPTALMVY